MAAVCGVLTKSSGETVEFEHAVCSSTTTQGRSEDFKNLALALKKLQDDVNSCLTEVIEQEKSNNSSSALLPNIDTEELSDDDSEDDDDENDKNISDKQSQNGGPLEPQSKKLRT